MRQQVVDFSGANADVIGPAPVEAAADRGCEWSLAGARGQVPPAGMRYAHQHLTEGREAAVAVQRHSWPNRYVERLPSTPLPMMLCLV